MAYFRKQTGLGTTCTTAAECTNMLDDRNATRTCPDGTKVAVYAACPETLGPVKCWDGSTVPGQFDGKKCPPITVGNVIRMPKFWGVVGVAAGAYFLFGRR